MGIKKTLSFHYIEMLLANRVVRLHLQPARKAFCKRPRYIQNGSLHIRYTCVHCMEIDWIRNKWTDTIDLLE